MHIFVFGDDQAFMITKHGQALGLTYEANAFIDSSGHSQLEFIYQRFFGSSNQQPGRWSAFF
ncbi:MAG: hypothetical protein AAFY82_10830, partial [Pseudomonadota bacterium]